MTIPRKSSVQSLRSLAGILAVFLLISLFAPAAFADSISSDVEVRGDTDGGFEFSSDNFDLFHLNSMAPGDIQTGTITLTNTSNNAVYVGLESITSQLADNTLYDALDLKIFHGNDVLYEGSYGKTPNPVTDQLRVPAGESIFLYVEVSLNPLTANSLQGKEMDSIWVFSAFANPTIATGNNILSGNTAPAMLLLLAAASCACIISVKIVRDKITAHAEMGDDSND